MQSQGFLLKSLPPKIPPNTTRALLLRLAVISFFFFFLLGRLFYTNICKRTSFLERTDIRLKIKPRVTTDMKRGRRY